MKIYQIAPALRLIFDEAFIDEDGVYHFDQKAFDEIAGNAREKIANCARFIREKEDGIEAMKRAENSIAERRKAEEKALVWLKQMTLSAIQELGEKVEMPDIRVSTRKSEAVEVDEGVLAKEWMTETITYKPNKTALKHALKNGEPVEGASLVTNYSLSIK